MAPAKLKGADEAASLKDKKKSKGHIFLYSQFSNTKYRQSCERQKKAEA